MSKETADLVAIEMLSAAEVFAEGGAGPVVAEIEAKARAVDADISSAKGRGDVASLSRKISTAKVALDNVGKAFVEGLKIQAKVVDAERKLIRDRLDALRDEVRRPLDEFEAKQQARIDEHQAELARLETAAVFDALEPTAEMIQDQIDRVRRIGTNRDWEEFAKRAEAARAKALETLAAMLDAAKHREAERAELEKLRRAQAEREQRDRDAKIAEQAAARARAEAERKAEEAAQVAERQRQSIEDERRAAETRAAKAEADRIAAEQRAAKAAEEATAAERRRIAAEQEKAAAEQARREANKRHRAKINNEVKFALVAQGRVDNEQAKAIIEAIVKGDVPHVTIQY